MEPALIYLVAALVSGLLASAVRLPPLLGFLAAGFVLEQSGVPLLPELGVASDLGVTLLLFTIGLKLDFRTLLERYVWASASVHMVLYTLATMLVLGLAALVGLTFEPSIDLRSLALVGFALSFSSTVFAVKHLEERGDDQSLYGRAAIGILLMQDIAATLFLAFTSGRLPSPWALLLVLIVPLMLGLRRLWTHVGHGDLELLAGIVLALVPGYWAFDAAGLKGELGALIIGMMLAPDPRAAGLAKSLLHLKDLLLVGFFLSIGYHGFPGPVEIGLALLLVTGLPAKSILFMLLIRLGRLRNRTSVLAGVTLGNYSEFGLIVAAVGHKLGLLDERWLLTIAIAVSISFVVAALEGRRESTFTERVANRFRNRPEERLHPDDRHVDIGTANAVVLGMGRVGRSAYLRLTEDPRVRVVGIDSDPYLTRALSNRGYRIIEGDATDEEFWLRVRTAGQLSIAVVALSNQEANLAALHHLQHAAEASVSAVVIRHEDERQAVLDAGADTALYVYSGAGHQLADEALGLLPDAGPAEPGPSSGQ